jgi:hypothetical protein
MSLDFKRKRLAFQTRVDPKIVYSFVVDGGGGDKAVRETRLVG